MKAFLKQLLYLSYLIIVCFFLLESAFRVYIYLSDDLRGFYTFFNIPPDEKYWDDLTSRINDSEYFVLDNTLGWKIKQNGVFRDSLYVSNSEGIRSNEEFGEKEDSTFRIGLFGDSFMHSDAVPYNESLAYHLEEILRKNGIAVDVINFGVSGYDMTQAYLKYKESGQNYDLDIVLFGFQIENFWRNLNVYRPNYYLYTGFPMVKPRVFLENDSLKFLDISDIDLEALKQLPLHFEESKLSEYEYFTHNRIFTKSGIFGWSYVVKIFSSFSSTHEGSHIGRIEDSIEGLKVMYFILNQFETLVKENNSEFLIVQLPNYELTDFIIKNGTYPNPSIIDTVSKHYNFIRLDSLLVKYPMEETYIYHYTSFGNKLISEKIASVLFRSAFLSTDNQKN